MKLKLEIEMDYNHDIMHGDDPDSISWFYNLLLNSDPEDPDSLLILHSNDIGDEIGTVRVLKIMR